MLSIGLENDRKKDSKNSGGKANFIWSSEMINKWEESLKRNIVFNGPSPYVAGKKGYRKPGILYKYNDKEKEENRNTRKTGNLQYVLHVKLQVV